MKILLLLLTVSFGSLASGTFIAPPPQPDTEIDCSKEENKDTEECLELAEGRY